MKKIKTSPYIIVTVLMYLLIAFIPWDFNPANWSQDNRYLFSVLTMAALSVVYVIKKIEES